jgi:hypothetical protein
VHPDILQADKNLCITILNVGTALWLVTVKKSKFFLLIT